MTQLKALLPMTVDQEIDLYIHGQDQITEELSMLEELGLHQERL